MIHPFLDSRKIVMQNLTKNPHPSAIDILKEYEGHIDFGELSTNETPEAIQLMMERTKGILSETQIRELSLNRSDEAVDLLLNGEVPIDWIYFSANSNSRAVAHIKDNEEKICWSNLNRNSHPDVCDLLEPSKLTQMLCFNTSDRALDILNENPRYILSYLIASNPNPKALEIIKNHNLLTGVLYSSTPLAMNNLAKSTNPDAIDLLIKNMDRFQWREIFANPSDKAVNLIEACHTGTWQQHCPYMAIDLRDKIEDQIRYARKSWATEEMCKNTNPRVLDLLRFSRDLNYESLSKNPIIFTN